MILDKSLLTARPQFSSLWNPELDQTIFKNFFNSSIFRSRHKRRSNTETHNPDPRRHRKAIISVNSLLFCPGIHSLDHGDDLGTGFYNCATQGLRKTDFDIWKRRVGWQCMKIRAQQHSDLPPVCSSSLSDALWEWGSRSTEVTLETQKTEGRAQARPNFFGLFSFSLFGLIF